MKHSNIWIVLVLIASALLLSAGDPSPTKSGIPSPRPTVTSSNESDFNHKKSDQKQGQSAQILIAPAKPDGQSDQASGDTKKTSGYDPLTLFTAGLLGVGFLQAFILWFTLITSRASIRAYLLTRCELAADIAVGTKISVTVVFKNFGHSPAYRVRYRGHIGFAEYPMLDGYKLPKIKEKFSSYFSVLPEVEYGQPMRASKPLTQAEIEEIREHHGQFFVYGEVRYRTLFIRGRYTKFAYFLVRSPNGYVPVLAPVGNDVN
jgi:hypothetical protein